MIVTDMTYIGDPQILLYEGTYYCYATSFVKGFHVWKSEDLEHWSAPKVCFIAPENYWGVKNFWAPEVVEHHGKFVMHFTARMANGGLRLGVAVSDSPEGPFTDVHGRPMFDLGYSTIDGSVLKYKGKNYFYYSRDCSENLVGDRLTSQLYCVELDDTLTETVGEHKLVTTPYLPFELHSEKVEKPSWKYPHIWNEGPCVMEVGGKLVMNYSANYYATNEYSICIAEAEDPFGPWIKHEEANPVLCARDGLFGAGHNAFFRTKDGDLMTSFHVQTNPDYPGENRRTCIGKVTFREENGVIYQDID